MTQHNQFSLLTTQRFVPLFITQFLGAFHDNLFKNALVALLLYTSWMNTTADPKMLTTLAAAVFIFPFILFSAVGGELADQYPKQRVIRWIKIAEMGIAILGGIAVLTGSIGMSFIVLFLLGTHSSFFSPSKYAILPEHLAPPELMGGNAIMNTGTFLAILLGTIVGTGMVLIPHGPIVAAASFILCAVLGYGASRQIPTGRMPEISTKRIRFNPFIQTVSVLKLALSGPKPVIRSIWGVSWFYFMGAMFLSQIPNYTKEVLWADHYVLILFLTLFSLGIAFGGLMNNRLLKGRIEGVFVPLASLGMSLFSVDLYFANAHLSPGTPENLLTISVFLSTPAHWRVLFDILMVAICGGIYAVPLNAIMQHQTPDPLRARVLAGSSVLDAIFIVASSVLAAVLIGTGFNIPQIFLIFALMNLVVSIYICSILPDYLLKTCLQILFKCLYRVEVHGIENIEKAGPRAVIVANHVSLLDPPLLAAFLPGRPMFAVNKFVAEWVWVKPFLRLVDAFPLDPASPFSIKSLIRRVEKNRQVVIFPEGRLTETGALMKVYDGPGMVADKTGAPILPVRLDGVQFLSWARLKGKFPVLMFPKITITILEPRTFTVDPEIKGGARRRAVGRKLFNLMEEMMFVTTNHPMTLWQGVLQAAALQGRKSIIAEDIAHRPLSFNRLIKGAMILGQKISTFTQSRENIGLMLPNSLGALTTFFALQATGRVPAMINYSAGASVALSCIETAKIKTVITSRVFITRARLDDFITTIGQYVQIVYIEDIQKEIGSFDKIRAVFMSPHTAFKTMQPTPDDPAVVLFTSGSEGSPKGVVLSHANLIANIAQLSSRVDFNRSDIVFNALPMFHSFGLTGGVLLPVLSGVRTFLYPSPLHYRIVPEVIYTTNATIMFGTNTFLKGYARMADPYDFYRMRYIFAGAERVDDQTRKIYLEKFGVKILEGYGTTETAPVIAVNSAMHHKPGTVGRMLPGMETQLDPVPGVADGARLSVRGPNVMLGYYKSDQPGVLQPPEDGWHDTGDIVAIDAQGFMTIVGRAKRFAKIGGEMISLASVEQLAISVWPDALHAAVAIHDPRKGERIVLLTTQIGADRLALSAFAQENGITNLNIPADVVVTNKMPLLGSGKIDYVGVKDLITQHQPSGAQ